MQPTEQTIDQIKTKEGFFDRDQTFVLCGKGFHFRHALPRKAKDWMAPDLAEASLVFDETLGLVYEGYTHELALVYLTMRYYTDFDLEAYSDSESWYTLYDLLESYGILDLLYGCLDADLQKVLRIYEKIKESAKYTFERERSLSYLAQKTFGSLLSTEDITATIAQAEGVNHTMIELLESFNRLRPGPSASPVGSIVSFRKKDLQGSSNPAT